MRAQVDVAEATLPDAPDPQSPASSPTPQPNPCPSGSSRHSAAPAGALNLNSGSPDGNGNGVRPALVPCTPRRLNWYLRFANGPHDKPLTPRDKAWLAARNLFDPFNLITIAGDAGIAVAADSHSAYGPGFPGWGRNVGVSFTEDMTGEFFGTFLIPSVVHQDPHYYRMEKAGIPRRVFHAITQVFWTQSDSGRGMPNYANLVGFAFDDAIANLYVPDRQTDPGASVHRYAVGLATAPIGNFVNEFVPDLASHIHVQVVIIQRIINQVANKETMGSASQ
ncbi:hypothetical protein DYQ86_07510 [Acidobacteria bacterium AB60]|nr:hypothetical protein DYQ86_07510 [Acidobacteria bacterium AB60]